MESFTFEARQTPRRISRLVVAAHADDEVLGCGGMLSKHREESAVVVLPELDEDRTLEFKQAQIALGYPESFFFGLPDGDIGNDMHRLVGMLGTLLSVTCPAELYLPFPSVDRDRASAHEAGMRSVRLAIARHQRQTPAILLYDTDARDAAHYPADVRWNRCEPLSERDIECKATAVRTYRCRADRGAPFVQGVRDCARLVGAARHVPWAEQFALVRAARGVTEGTTGETAAGTLSAWSTAGERR